MSVTDRKMDRLSLSARSPLLFPPLVDGVLTHPVISLNGDPTKFDVSAFSYRLNGSVYYTAAQTALVFSAIHATGIGAWFGCQLMIDKNGAITTKANPNTGAQNFGSEALALASLQYADPGKITFGTITLLTNAAVFTANTTALNAADLVASNLLGDWPDMRWAQQRVYANVQVDDLNTFCRATSGVVNASLMVSHKGFTQTVTNPNLEVDARTVAAASKTNLRCGPFDYLIDGVFYHKEAAYGLTFTAAHPVTADKWGAILLLINAAGVYSTLISGATQTTAQAYTNSADARAALPPVPAGKCAIGILVIEAKNATWTANTDDLVAASDLEAFDLLPATPDRPISVAVPAIDAVPEKYKMAAFTDVIGGVKFAKTAQTAVTFTAAHVCALSKYLPILISIDTAGTLTTRVPLIDGRSQTASQGFDTYSAALAALPNAIAGRLGVAYIIIKAGVAAWTANTDDMVAGSDLAAVSFVSIRLNQKVQFSAVTPTNQSALFPSPNLIFTANGNEAAGLGVAKDIRPARCWTNGAVVLYLAGTTGTLQYPSAVLTTRPFPLNEEASSVATVTGS